MDIFRWAARASSEFYTWHVWTKSYLLFGMLFGWALNQPDCPRCVQIFVPSLTLVATIWGIVCTFWFLKWYYDAYLLQTDGQRHRAL